MNTGLREQTIEMIVEFQSEIEVENSLDFIKNAMREGCKGLNNLTDEEVVDEFLSVFFHLIENKIGTEEGKNLCVEMIQALDDELILLLKLVKSGYKSNRLHRIHEELLKHGAGAVYYG